MEKKKVIFCLIRSLSNDEKLLFKKKIPYNKTNNIAQRLAKLFEFFEKTTTDNFDFDTINSSKIVELLKVSTHKKLGPYYDELITDLRNFLLEKELHLHNQLEKQLLLQKALRRREENIYIQQLHIDIRQYISNTPPPFPEEYHYRSSFYNDLYSHTSVDTNKSEGLLYLYQSETNLDIFYWIQKLRLLVEKSNRAMVLSSENHLLEELPSLPDLARYTQNNDVHLLSIYAYIYQFAKIPFQSQNLDTAIRLIKTAPQIPKEDRGRILNYLNSLIFYYTTKKTPICSDLQSKDTYKVYKLGFSNLWFVQADGCIIFEDFVNVLYLAFFNKDSDFLEILSEDFQQYIPDGYAPFINSLCKGYNFFLHQKWAKVLGIFSNQELPNMSHRIHYLVQRNVLEIKTLLESLIQDKKEFGDVYNSLDKHKKFIQREFKASSPNKQRNLYFVDLLKKIYPYLNKRIEFRLDKAMASAEIQVWQKEVEAHQGQTIEYGWLESIGQRLQAEVQKTAVKRS